MKILVTGGAGFIGSHVVDTFLGAGHEVAVVDNFSTGNRAWVNPRAKLHAVDLRSNRLAEVFATERPAVVAHLAAQAAVGRSVTDPVFDASVNVGGGLNLLDCCRRFGVRRMIYSSSGGAGYGDTDGCVVGHRQRKNGIGRARRETVVTFRHRAGQDGSEFLVDHRESSFLKKS